MTAGDKMLLAVIEYYGNERYNGGDDVFQISDINI